MEGVPKQVAQPAEPHKLALDAGEAGRYFPLPLLDRIEAGAELDDISTQLPDLGHPWRVLDGP